MWPFRDRRRERFPRGWFLSDDEKSLLELGIELQTKADALFAMIEARRAPVPQDLVLFQLNGDLLLAASTLTRVMVMPGGFVLCSSDVYWLRKPLLRDGLAAELEGILTTDEAELLREILGIDQKIRAEASVRGLVG